MATIRPAQIDDASAIAHVHVDTWRTTYPGIIPAEHLAKLSYERSQAGWIDHLTNHPEERVFVAEAEPGQIVGFVSGGPIREPLADFDAEVYVLYILQAFQGSGFGRQLLSRVAQDLVERSYRSVVIWVMKDNAARQFYEKLGGQYAGEEGIEIGGKALLKVAYSWQDLTTLIQAD